MKKWPAKAKRIHTSMTGTGADKNSGTKNKCLEGNRIVNLDKLQQYTDRLTQHSSSCNGSSSLCGESRDGLASILKAECNNCEMYFNLDTSKKVKGPRAYSR